MTGSDATPVLPEITDSLADAFSHPDELLDDDAHRREMGQLGKIARSRRNTEAESGSLRLG